MAPTCVNLREHFGDRYKLVYEESYAAAYGSKAIRDDAWMQIIPGARGHVYPHSEAMLAATTDTSGLMARRLKALPFVQVYTDGSDGVTVLFPPERFEEVADLLRLRRRRRVSDQERQRLAALGRQYGFLPRKAGLQSDSEALESTQTALVDPRYVPHQMSLFRPWNPRESGRQLENSGCSAPFPSLLGRGTKTMDSQNERLL